MRHAGRLRIGALLLASADAAMICGGGAFAADIPGLREAAAMSLL